MFTDRWDECAHTLKALLVIVAVAIFAVGFTLGFAACVFL